MPVTSIAEPTPSTLHDCIDLTSPSPSPDPSPSPSSPLPASPTRDKIMTRSRSSALSTPPSSSSSSTTDTELCTICYLPLSTPHAPRDSHERLAALPCGHIFGHICLLTWLRVAPASTCPMCRMDLVHRKCRHPVVPAAVSVAPPFLAMHPAPAKATTPPTAAAEDDVVVVDVRGRQDGKEGEGKMVMEKLEEKCILCRGEEGLAAEMLRFERRKFEAEKRMLKTLRQLPLCAGMGGMSATEIDALEEKIKGVEGRWDDAWLRCQEYVRVKW